MKTRYRCCVGAGKPFQCPNEAHWVTLNDGIRTPTRMIWCADHHDPYDRISDGKKRTRRIKPSDAATLNQPWNLLPARPTQGDEKLP